MQAIFVRHAAAAKAAKGGDTARPLTDEGREQARATAEALQAMGVWVEVILTSPLARAAETADILAGVETGAEVEPLEALAPPADALGVARRLRELCEAGVKTVALVGHAPTIDVCIGQLVLGRDSIGTSLPKAGAACLDLPEGDSDEPVELLWLLRRDQLARIARRD